MIVESNQEKYQLDSNRWISTLPKKNTDNTIRKYSLTIFLFVVGLILVSTIKNETRNLQKKINNLKKSQPHIARIDFLLDYRIYLVVSIFLNLIMKPE